MKFTTIVRHAATSMLDLAVQSSHKPMLFAKIPEGEWCARALKELEALRAGLLRPLLGTPVV